MSNHMIAGQVHAQEATPSTSVDAALKLAEEAFAAYSTTSKAQRAALLSAIADQLLASKQAFLEATPRETNLPAARVESELMRTTGQLQYFANHILTSHCFDWVVDDALPDRTPLPRPKLEQAQRPVGPVVVFGASNFPLAFSVAGGDTASALAAGCPVVVKGHEAHPETGRIAAEAIVAALKQQALPLGVFSMIQGGGADTGIALVEHPLTSAVGFTGSALAGISLFKRCVARDVPIPFYGELGAVNPVIVMPGALAESADSLATQWAQSVTLGTGQFCTNPGLVFVPQGEQGDQFIQMAAGQVAACALHPMLTPAMAEHYQNATRQLEATGVKVVLSNNQQVAAMIAEVDVATLLATPSLSHEIFGPAAVMVRYDDDAQLQAAIKQLEGQLTCTLLINEQDHAAAKNLMPILERKAGRLLINGFPTGVEVCDAMVHGGPWPASTNFGYTSVGSQAIHRWLRAVCYQNFPQSLLPQL